MTLTPAQLAAGTAAAFAVKENVREPSFTRDPTPYVLAIGRAVLDAMPIIKPQRKTKATRKTTKAQEGI